MPTLTRSIREGIQIGNDIRITVLRVYRGEVRLHVAVPDAVDVAAVNRDGLARNLRRLDVAVRLQQASPL